MSNIKVLCTKLVLNITKLAWNIRLPMDGLKTRKDIKRERKSGHNACARPNEVFGARAVIMCYVQSASQC